jgi:hypothetical protein
MQYCFAISRRIETQPPPYNATQLPRTIQQFYNLPALLSFSLYYLLSSLPPHRSFLLLITSKHSSCFHTIYKWIQRQFKAIGAHLQLCNLFPHPQTPSTRILNTSRNGRPHLRQLASKKKHENTQRRIGMPRDRRSQGCMRTVL